MIDFEFYTNFLEEVLWFWNIPAFQSLQRAERSEVCDTWQ
jgi:hypothetical protein